jgi:hypothetical protein
VCREYKEPKHLGNSYKEYKEDTKNTKPINTKEEKQTQHKFNWGEWMGIASDNAWRLWATTGRPLSSWDRKGLPWTADNRRWENECYENRKWYKFIPNPYIFQIYNLICETHIESYKFNGRLKTWLYVYG